MSIKNLKIGIVVLILILGINASCAASTDPAPTISKEQALEIAKLQEGTQKDIITIHDAKLVSIKQIPDVSKLVWQVDVSMPHGRGALKWHVYVDAYTGWSVKSKNTEPVEGETVWRPVEELKVVYLAELVGGNGYYYRMPMDEKINNESVWTVTVDEIANCNSDGYIHGEHLGCIYVSMDAKKAKWSFEEKWWTLEELENHELIR